LPRKVLVYGIGNPGRQDDALGILLVDKLNEWIREKGVESIQTDQNYQLNIEDAELISEFDLVIFIDASVIDIESTYFEKIVPDYRTDFSMHSVEPSFVVGICYQIFNKKPDCYQLHIKGYKFDFMKPMTVEAQDNLNKAFDKILSVLSEKADVV
jgi:hydrogenase maturation protease